MSGKKQSKPREDLTGQLFGHLRVLRMERGEKEFVAVCRCERCQKEPVIARPASLKNEHTRSCGCLGKGQKEDYVGRRFGYLEVIAVRSEYCAERKKFRYFAVCYCRNCGKENYEVLVASLKRGSTTSCGCRRDQYDKMRGEKHVQYTGYKGITGSAWGDYRARATKRGFPFTWKIEDAWALYEEQKGLCAMTGLPIHFGDWKKKQTASPDRLDIAKGYEKGNVQWVHKDVNIMRNVFPIEYFVEMCQRVVQTRGTSNASQVC